MRPKQCTLLHWGNVVLPDLKCQRLNHAVGSASTLFHNRSKNHRLLLTRDMPIYIHQYIVHNHLYYRKDETNSISYKLDNRTVTCKAHKYLLLQAIRKIMPERIFARQINGKNFLVHIGNPSQVANKSYFYGQYLSRIRKQGKGSYA